MLWLPRVSGVIWVILSQVGNVWSGKAMLKRASESNSLIKASRLRAPTRNDSINQYLYERSTCRYVRLNALNLLHVHGPRFYAP